jgi:hypothetical protein
MIRADYTRIVGALCVAAATVPLTARTTLEIWEMGLVAILIGLGSFLLSAGALGAPEHWRR